MIMSPFVLDRNVPLIGPPKGGQIGADGDEQEGIGNCRGAGASAQQAVAAGGCLPADARELPAGEAAVEALSGGRWRWAEASQRGTDRRIVLTTKSIGGRYCGWSGRSTAGQWANDLGRRWRRNTWHRRMGCRWMPKRCDAGCWRKGCGVASGSDGLTVGGASARNTLGSWCRWTGASTHGWRSAGQRAA